MTELNTFSPFDDSWVILTTLQTYNYFRARRDDIRFAFDPPRFVDKNTVVDRVSDSLWYSWNDIAPNLERSQSMT